MTYTIKINDKTNKAKSIINMLKALKEDYDFIDIQSEEDTNKNSHLEILKTRMKSFEEDKIKGKNWEDLKKELVK